MAKTNLYQLYDLEAQSVSGPIVAELRHAPAIRMFNELLGNEKTLPGQYPAHFHLVWVGTQDTESAEITPVMPPIPVATGADWVEARKKAAERAYELDPKEQREKQLAQLR